MKKINKALSIALSALLAAGTVGVFAGCGGRGQGGSGGGEAIDKTRTQLYVRNYQGGFGNKWLYNGKAKFEAKYNGVSLEDGKSGVQVIITDVKQTPEITNIQNDIYEVYFVEKLSYLYLYKQNAVEDITDIVTKANPYDAKTIESKMTAQQQDFFGVKDGEDTKYYALPHYMAGVGIVYDIDLFEDRGYYFAYGYEDQTDVNQMFIVDSEDKRSAGPNGKYGDEDDGLPATYEDFWNLCEYIKGDTVTPLNWGGTGGTQFYVTALMIQLMANYQGKDDFMKNFTMTGDMPELVKLDSQGKMIFDANGNPETETVTLNGTDNGYEPFRHVSYYYALEFLKKLMDTVGTYSIEANINVGSYDAFAAQKDYVASRFSSEIQRQAMLIEGTWWDSEATEYFDSNVKLFGDKGKKENCNYGWMPLPHATRDQIGNDNTIVNTIDSLCFVKKGLSQMKKDLAFDFVQMMNSDEALADFTVQTNAFKDFNYDLSPEQVNSLSPFGKEMHKNLQTWDIIFPHNNNAQYYNSVYMTASSRRYGIEANSFPAMVFSTNKAMTAKEYFEKTFKYTKNSVSLWANK